MTVSRTQKIGPVTAAEFIRRNILQMSQVELGRQLRVSATWVSAWETGKGVIPQRHREGVAALANQMGRTLLPEWFDKLPFSVDL